MSLSPPAPSNPCVNRHDAQRAGGRMPCGPTIALAPSPDRDDDHWVSGRGCRRRVPRTAPSASWTRCRPAVLRRSAAASTVPCRSGRLAAHLWQTWRAESMSSNSPRRPRTARAADSPGLAASVGVHLRPERDAPAGTPATSAVGEHGVRPEALPRGRGRHRRMASAVTERSRAVGSSGSGLYHASAPGSRPRP